MAFNANEYPRTQREAERLDRIERHNQYEAREARMQAWNEGMCSLGAAMEGGARYEREIAESALELSERTGIPTPIAEALAGWLGAVTPNTGKTRRAA